MTLKYTYSKENERKLKRLEKVFPSLLPKELQEKFSHVVVVR